MEFRKIISAAVTFASRKQDYLLSELRNTLPYAIALPELYHVLAPRLHSLGMTATKAGSDYRITVSSKQSSYTPGDRERMRIGEFLSARRMPRSLEQAVEQYIEKKVQKPWNDPVILNRLRRAIVVQKGEYWRDPKDRIPSYTKGYSVLGYLAYQFPVYFMQTEHLLYELASAGLLKRRMMYLDVGTGPGVVPLAIADFYSRLDDAYAVVTSIEQSEEHIEAFKFLSGRSAAYSPNVAIDLPIRADIRVIPEDSLLLDPVDMIFFSNVLGELSALSIGERAEIVMRIAACLAPDGSIVIAEPAERENSVRLRQLSHALVDRGLTIHSPCPDLWGTRCDPSRCWSFETQADIMPTRLMEQLAAGNEPFRYINTDLKYAYVILKKDRNVKQPYRVPPRSKFARFSKLHLHVNRRINVIAAKMSQELGDKKTHVFKLCDGTPAKPVYGVLPSYHQTASNKGITTAPYGTIIEIHNVLVRYNRAHDAYNLLISKNTRIFPAGKSTARRKN